MGRKKGEKETPEHVAGIVWREFYLSYNEIVYSQVEECWVALERYILSTTDVTIRRGNIVSVHPITWHSKYTISGDNPPNPSIYPSNSSNVEETHLAVSWVFVHVFMSSTPVFQSLRPFSVNSSGREGIEKGC